MEPHPPAFKAFGEALHLLTQKHGRGRIFDDFLTLATCAWHPATIIQVRAGEPPDPENERVYLETASRYSRDELNTFGRAQGCLLASAEAAPFTDLLGTWFEEHLSNERAGQFFTPMELCTMMAKMTLPDGGETGLRIADPCCGSGRLLLACAGEQYEHWYFGADVDRTCALMSCLNMFLNGLRGEVAWMDSLRLEIHGVWRINDEALGIQPIAIERSYFHAQSEGFRAPKLATNVVTSRPRASQELTTRPAPLAGGSSQLLLF